MKTPFCVAAIAALAAAFALPAAAQEKKPLAMGQVVSVTTTVEAIDSSNRVVTLKGPDGNLVAVQVPDSVKRFSEIKVGDRLTFKYSESLIIAVKKADPGAKLGTSTDTGLKRGTGEKPSAVVSQTTTATVEVAAIDAKIPSMTVRKADGSTQSFRVEDPKNLEGVKTGDHIVVTYREAVALQVAAPPAK
jgi:Cu/Ag efflux protein CusF